MPDACDNMTAADTSFHPPLIIAKGKTMKKTNIIKKLMLAAVMLPLAAQAAQAAERASFGEPPKDFKIGYQTEQNGMIMVELVPQKQTVDNWTKMITLQSMAGAKPGVERFRADMASLWQNACPKGNFDTVREGEENYEIKPITGFPTIDMWFVDVPYRTKIVQNVLQHLALPTLVLCILPTMEFIRIIQQRADYLLQQEYAKAAVTRGWSKWTILKRYVFRNTFPLLIPQLTRVFTLVLTQCMLVENVLGWPGIGRWLIDAVTQQDYNSISAGVVVIGVCIIIIDTLAKSLMFMLDPFNKKGWYAR